MTTMQHNNTTIIVDTENTLDEEGTQDYVTFIKGCLDFYKKSTPTVIIVKNSSMESRNLGLTVQEINGFVLFADNIKRLARVHSAKVNPRATTIHCIVDTCFHELHHVESYSVDPQWVIDNREEEEAFANKTASELCIEFFKTKHIPVWVKPYVYKNENEIVTDLREYFNILLDGDNHWEPLGISTNGQPEVTTETPNTDPITKISSAEAKILYMSCFNKLKDCVSNPENVLTPIEIPPIVESSCSMDVHGVITRTKTLNIMSGIIDKHTKEPLYLFALRDGKQRYIAYSNLSDTGCVMDSESNEKILMFKNNTLSAWPKV